jgi:hypothetical protein
MSGRRGKGRIKEEETRNIDGTFDIFEIIITQIFLGYKLSTK